MLKTVDNMLDKITMYRLVLYGLIGLLVVAMVFGFLGIIPYSPGSILFSTAFILFLCLITNGIFSHVFEAPTGVESAYITALILALIITPFRGTQDLPILFWAPILAMASKYILAINRKHIFNPAAVAVALTALWISSPASWWVGTTPMMPFVFVFGLLIVRKIRREEMVVVFLAVAFVTEIFFTLYHGGNTALTLKTLLFNSSLIFFAFVMLTEPFTTPPTRSLRMFYAGFVGFLFSPHIHLGTFYSTPELALVTGNIFSYLVSPRQKLFLALKEKVRYGDDVVDFLFTSKAGRFTFEPGQYMEWTLPHDDPDSRGNRRYFTLASSPTEEDIHLGVKFYSQGSSFKKALTQIDETTKFVAGNLSGDFTMPEDTSKKLVFIAGGIGITPFRSMIKYCIDTHAKRDIVLLYSNKVHTEIAYTDVLQEATRAGVKTVLTLTDEKSIPKNWPGKVGRFTPDVVKEEIPDFMERLFYISGPHPMVTATEQMLEKMGVSIFNIKKDFFPGYV